MSSTSDGVAVTATSLTTALTTLTDKLNEHLDKHADASQRLGEIYREQSEPNSPEFFEILSRVRHPVIYMFVDLFKSLGVLTFAELEDLWKPFYSVAAVRDAVDEFLDIQDHFGDAFRGFEIPVPKDQSKLGENGPIDIPLVNPRNGEQSSIRDYIGEWNLLVILLRHYM